ncbi:MAG: hypothetical protein MJ238_04760 [Bacilli bacterium]|nr:hypothetical protein [Bacilli bacterium]
MKDLVKMASAMADNLEKDVECGCCISPVKKGQVNRMLTALYLSINKGADTQVMEELMERIAYANNILSGYGE